MRETQRIVRENGLHTVCEEAGCPNIGECWEKKHATFMIMGDTCTRACAFCNVKTGLPGALDANEPEHVAEAVAKLGLDHVVITSVDRDDLDDGGARHFAHIIRAIRAAPPDTTIEVLTPDFLRKDGALEIVVAARPDVFNHNLETVPRLISPSGRARATSRSIRLLQRVKELDPTMFTKSGFMVGLGEERNEVMQLMDDLRSADVDFLTIGQYLQPSRKHTGDPLLAARRVQSLRDDRIRQGLPDGLGEPADALVVSCRRDFARLQGRARKRRSDTKFRCAACLSSARRVRARRRCRRASPRNLAYRYTISIITTGCQAGGIATTRTRSEAVRAIARDTRMGHGREFLRHVRLAHASRRHAGVAGLSARVMASVAC